jgi:hypothetical protein
MPRTRLMAGSLALVLVALYGCAAGASTAASPPPAIAYDPCAIPSMSYGPGKAEAMAGICNQTLPPGSGTLVAWLDAPYDGPESTPTPTPDLAAMYPKCSSADLEVTFVGWNSGDLGAQGWIVIRTKGAATCLLEGGPQLSLLDATGAVLGTGVGGDGPPPPAVLRPGLTEQSSAAPSEGPLGPELVPGYGYSSVRVSGFCDLSRPATALYAVFPDGAKFRLAVPSLPASSCTSSLGKNLGEGWFESVDKPQATTLPTAWLQPILALPAQAVVGQVTHFTVALQNNYPVPINLDPCPVYTTRVTILTSSGHEDSQLIQADTLNCSQVRTVAPKSAVIFAMQIPIPADAPPADSLQVDWWLGTPGSPNIGPVTHLVRLVPAG